MFQHRNIVALLFCVIHLAYAVPFPSEEVEYNDTNEDSSEEGEPCLECYNSEKSNESDAKDLIFTFPQQNQHKKQLNQPKVLDLINLLSLILGPKIGKDVEIHLNIVDDSMEKGPEYDVEYGQTKSRSKRQVYDMNYVNDAAKIEGNVQNGVSNGFENDDLKGIVTFQSVSNPSSNEDVTATPVTPVDDNEQNFEAKHFQDSSIVNNNYPSGNYGDPSTNTAVNVNLSGGYLADYNRTFNYDLNDNQNNNINNVSNDESSQLNNNYAYVNPQVFHSDAVDKTIDVSSDYKNYTNNDNKNNTAVNYEQNGGLFESDSNNWSVNLSGVSNNDSNVNDPYNWSDISSVNFKNVSNLSDSNVWSDNSSGLLKVEQTPESQSDKSEKEWQVSSNKLAIERQVLNNNGPIMASLENTVLAACQSLLAFEKSIAKRRHGDENLNTNDVASPFENLSHAGTQKDSKLQTSSLDTNNLIDVTTPLRVPPNFFTQTKTQENSLLQNIETRFRRKRDINEKSPEIKNFRTKRQLLGDVNRFLLNLAKIPTHATNELIDAVLKPDDKETLEVYDERDKREASMIDESDLFNDVTIEANERSSLGVATVLRLIGLGEKDLVKKLHEDDDSELRKDEKEVINSSVVDDGNNKVEIDKIEKASDDMDFEKPSRLQEILNLIRPIQVNVYMDKLKKYIRKRNRKY